MKDPKKAVEETRKIAELAATAHVYALDFSGLLEPTTQEHARIKAVGCLEELRDHLLAALATLE